MNSNKVYFALLFVILLGGASIRLLALRADPPPAMAGDFVSDEAWWAHNARNQALFGTWVLDDFNQGLFAAPLHTAMIRLSFMWGGVCLAQTRLVSAISGLVTIALVGVLLTQELGRWNGLAAMLILAFDYYVVSYDRVGLVEPLPTALMTLVAILVILARHRTYALGIAGAVAVMAYFAKANAVFFLATPMIFMLSSRRRFRPTQGASRKILTWELGAYVSGALACFAVWLVFFILPNWNEYLFQVGRLRDESKAKGIFVFSNFCMFAMAETDGIPRYTQFLTQALLPLGLASLWGIHTGALICRQGLRVTISELSDLERFASIWVITFLPYFVNHMSYSSQRYHVFVVPMTILGVHLLGPRRRELLSLRFNPGLGFSSPSYLAALLLIALPFILYLRLPTMRLFQMWTDTLDIGTNRGLSVSIVAALATLILSVVCLATFSLAFHASPRKSAPVGAIAWLLVALLLPFQLVAIGREANRLSYTIEEATAELKARIGEEARVIDGFTLVFGTRNRYLVLLDRRRSGYGFFGKRLVPTYRPTHVAIGGECSEADFALKARDELSGWGRYVPGTLHVLRFCHGKGGTLRFAMTMGEVTAVE